MREFKQATVTRFGVFAIDTRNIVWFRVGTGGPRGCKLDRRGNYWQRYFFLSQKTGEITVKFRIEPKLRTIGVFDWRRGETESGHLYGYDEAGDFYIMKSANFKTNGEILIPWQKFA